MYLHLGRDYIVHTRDIIGIFDLETTTLTKRGREFLDKAQTQGAVVSLSEDIPRSFVLSDWPTDTDSTKPTSEISSANRESSVKGSRSSRRQRRKYLELFMVGHPVRYGHDPAGCFHQRLKRRCAIRQTHFVAHSVRQQREGQGFFWLKVASLTIRS